MPNPTAGLRHVALFIQNYAECKAFYTAIIGMTIDWEPDENNVYLTSGADNFALHRAPKDFQPEKYQRLDHIGFFLNTPQDVDDWFEHMKAQNVTIKAPPKNHRDGTRSFYCADPDGNTVQMIHVPSIKKV